MTRTTDSSTGLIGETIVVAWRPLPLGDPDPLAAEACRGDRLSARLYLVGMPQQATLPAPLLGFYATTDGLLDTYSDADTTEVDANDTTYLLLHTDTLPANLHTGLEVGDVGYGGLPFAGTQYLLQGTLDGQPFSFTFEIDAAQDYTGTLIEGSVPIEQVTVDYTPASGSLGALWAERVDTALDLTGTGGTTVTRVAAGEYVFSSHSRLDQLDAATADYSMGGNQLTNLGAPSAGTDATTKTWVQSAIEEALTGLTWKQSVWVATTADIDLASAPATIDGVTLNSAHALSARRVLVKDQADPTENGLYEWVDSGQAMVRTDDANSSTELRGASVFVVSGSANGDTQWSQTEAANVIGTSPILWEQIGALVSYSAAPGGGLQLSGTAFSIAADGVGAAELDVTLNDVGAPTALFNMNNQRLAGLALPTSGADATSMNWVKDNAVSQSTLPNAKGDLAVASAADTFTRLAVGGNDRILTADSGQATGVKWGRKITDGTSAPGSPSTGDIWLDTTP